MVLSDTYEDVTGDAPCIQPVNEAAKKMGDRHDV